MLESNDFFYFFFVTNGYHDSYSSKKINDFAFWISIFGFIHHWNIQYSPWVALNSTKLGVIHYLKSL
jgi:hypothetical protein